MRLHGRQSGKALIGNLFVFALIGYGIFVGIQYIPQKIESGTISSIVESVEQRHRSTPITNDRELWAVVDAQLSVNDMTDMRQYFRTAWDLGQGTLTVAYERELNLLFTTRKMEYREEVVLRN